MTILYDSSLMRTLETTQFTSIFVGKVSTLKKYCVTLQSFLKFWPCSLQRLFQRPKLFHLNTKMFVNQGFGVFWWW